MKRLIRHGGLWLLLLFLWPAAASGQTLDTLKVSRIVITNVGPAVASDEFVRANIRIKEGDAYNPRVRNDDIASLYATGLFAQIQIRDQFTSEGVNLIYILQGKFKLTGINFEGNTKYSNSRLQKKVKSRIGEAVDEYKLFEDRLEIEKMYEKAGYTHTDVNYQLVNIDQAAGHAAVLFQVKETPKVKIEDVVFTGATAFSQKTLRKEIKTRRRWMFSWLTRSGIFKEDVFAEDQYKLTDFYLDAGYLDFEIKATNITLPTPKRMKIEFVLSEGKPYRVGTVTIKGNKLFTTDQIIQGLKDLHGFRRLKTKIGEHGLEADNGMLFRPKALSADIQAIEDFYSMRGYLEVTPRGPGSGLHVVQIPNTATGTMDLEYRITEGQISRIEKIEIRNNIKTKDKVIRRELSVAPGDVFDMVQVKLSQQRLEGLEYFTRDSVKAVPEIDPTLGPDRKNLIISVEEQPTGSLQFGAGFNTIENISAFVSVEQINFDLFHPPYFTGGGQKFRLSLQLGTRIQNYRLGFEEPWFLNRHLILAVELYRTVYDFQSLDNLYNEAHTGASVSLTRALFGRENIRGTLSYNIDNTEIFNVNTNAPDVIINDSGSALLHRFGLALAYDTRNEVRLSNKGQLTTISSTLTTGEHNHLKLGLSTAWYFKGFGEGHVLEVVGKAGVAQKLGNRDLPFYDKYYLGGLRDLRGYDHRQVGPRAVSQDGTIYEPIGGNTFWMGSVEYSIPIIQQLRFAMFYDIGNVSARPWSNSGFPVLGRANQGVGGPVPGFTQFPAGNTGAYSDNFGFGLHLDIPKLPIRLDFGIPLHHDKFNSDSGKFQFGAGFFRPL